VTTGIELINLAIKKAFADSAIHKSLQPGKITYRSVIYYQSLFLSATGEKALAHFLFFLKNF